MISTRFPVLVGRIQAMIHHHVSIPKHAIMDEDISTGFPVWGRSQYIIVGIWSTPPELPLP